MKRLILTLCPLLLASCAGMEEAYRDQTCHREVGYEQGVNDAREGKPMDSRFAAVCDPTTRKAVMQAYREGYESERNQAALEADEDGVRLKMPGVDIRMGSKGRKAWMCELSPFTETFTGYGASRNQAAQDARRLCESKHHSMHCENPDCREDR